MTKIRKPPTKYQDWVLLREEWIEGQLIGGTRALNLREYSEKVGVAYATMCNRSAGGKWAEFLSIRRKANDELMAVQLKERSEKALELVNQEFVNREADIRSRHARIARGLQAKAFQKLGTVKVESLSVREALSMLQLGLSEERFAMGMPETYKAPPDEQSQHSEYKPLAQQWDGHKRIQEVAVLLLKKLKEKGGTPTLSEATILNEVGLGGDPPQ